MGAFSLLASFDTFTLTWHYLFAQLVAGLTLGSLYALLALGYSMVYGILKLLNFAHGEVFMIGSYIGYFVLTAFGGAVNPGIPVVLLIVLMVVLIQLVSRTQVGRAMRATSYDLEAASMMGIDIDRVIVFTFFVGSALAGAGGVMNGLIFQNVNPYVGFNAGLKAFTAAVVGGIGSIPGAMFGGLTIGVAQAFATGSTGSRHPCVSSCSGAPSRSSR